MRFSVRSVGLLSAAVSFASSQVGYCSVVPLRAVTVMAQTDHDSETTTPAPSTSTAVAPPDSSTVVLTAPEREYIGLINKERQTRNLGTLDVDPMLIKIARQHSQEMSDRDYFDHYSPTPGIKTPLDRYIKALHDGSCGTPDYALVGENIFYCSVMDDKYNVTYGHNQLMNSPHHRENILEPKFEKVGVGLYISPTGAVWVTEMFLRDEPVGVPEASHPSDSGGHNVATVP